MIDIEKYEKYVFNEIEKENSMKIVKFLLDNKCDYVDELVEDYLDLFTFSYDEFVSKFNKLNEKYNNNLINEIKEDMNILEEFYLI